jgi:hypothetical protein
MGNHIITSTSQVLVTTMLFFLIAGNYKMYKDGLAPSVAMLVASSMHILLLFRNLYGDTHEYGCFENKELLVDAL